MSAPRGGHTSTLLQNGAVLIAGGYGFFGNGVFEGPYFSAEVYTPPSDNSRVAITASNNSANVRQGGSFTMTFGGSNLTDETYFDVRFHSPGSDVDQFVSNWQRGRSSVHDVPIGMEAGTFAITGVRAHQRFDDDASDYFPVLALVSVTGDSVGTRP
jgi:hypothetical protein